MSKLNVRTLQDGVFRIQRNFYYADEVDAKIAELEAKLEKAKEALRMINTKEALKANGGIEVMAWIFRLEEIAKEALKELGE